ncbi:MAG: DUF1080 domain-containing protein [Planctomycetes bacterium]|nr:DUF1080 domain-containing protein [Planctomycetota bacterium]
MVRCAALAPWIVAGVAAGLWAVAPSTAAPSAGEWSGASALAPLAASAVAVAPLAPADRLAAAPADTKLALFNGKDLAGWKQILGDQGADPAKTWSIVDGVIRCTGTPAGYLRTEQSFKNYFLVVEWRWPENPTNSGVLLHMQGDDRVWPKSVEAQLQSGNAGDFWFIDGATAKVDDARRNPGAAINVFALTKAEKKPGEWNRYEITCIDGTVILVVNGELMNIGRDCTPSEGHICLQSEGSPIEFRKVDLTPIP